MIEFLRGFEVLGGLAVLALSLIFVLLCVFAMIRWLYYRRFKSDRIKRGDIVRNLTDETESTVEKVKSDTELILKNKPRRNYE